MDVKQVAKLANLTLTAAEEKKFSQQFADTLKTISLINELDTGSVQPTFQVTGLTNIMREDTIDPARILPLKVVLQGAPKSHNGFIVVPAIFNQ